MYVCVCVSVCLSGCLDVHVFKFISIFTKTLITSQIIVYYTMSCTLGCASRYRHVSPMYWIIVALCFLTSSQNREAENFFAIASVAPVNALNIKDEDQTTEMHKTFLRFQVYNSSCELTR